MLIGGSSDLNKATDAQIPSIRFEMVVKSQSIDATTIDLKLESTDREVLAAIQPSLPNCQCVSARALVMEVTIRSKYVDRFQLVLNWRKACIEQADKDPAAVGHPNRRSAEKPWYKLVTLPLEVLPDSKRDRFEDQIPTEE